MTKQPRPYRAGARVARGLCDVGHVMYLMDNRQQYLQGLVDVLTRELKKVKKERGK